MTTIPVSSSHLRRAAEIVTDPTIEIERRACWGNATILDTDLPEYERNTLIGLILGKGNQRVMGVDYTVQSACTISFIALAMNVNPYDINTTVCDAFDAAGQGCPHVLAEVATKDQLVNALLAVADHLAGEGK